MKSPLESLIGNTPLLRLNTLSEAYNTNVYGKLEYYNPGMSSKDRPALFMMKDALRRGKISKGGTIIEASSGNTGLGVAMISRIYGFKCKVFTTDKISEEKLKALKAQGASITICPSEISASHPESTISKAKEFEALTENSYFCNQYYNEMNPMSHYKTTGPELYKQTEGLITHFIAGIGTGGTVSGVGRYLKEKNEDIQIVGVDPKGSVIYDYFYHGEIIEENKSNYHIEGIGKGYIPGSFHREYVDRIIQVTDLEAIEALQSFCLNEGILLGYSSGAVLKSLELMKNELTPHDQVVLFFPDHGLRYISKIYNKEWVAKLRQALLLEA